MSARIWFHRVGIATFLRQLVLSAIVALAIAGEAVAVQPFDDAAFEAAQAAGKPVLIDVTASWCPTCRAQKPILERLEAEFPSLIVYEIDFDSRKDLLKRFRVRVQSTLIVFKGTEEVGRSTGDTNPASIQALVARGL